MVNAGHLEVLGPLASAYVECTLYGEERGRWRGAIRDFKDDMEEYEIIKGYRVRTEKEIEKETMRYLRVLWNSRQRHERWRDSVLV